MKGYYRVVMGLFGGIVDFQIPRSLQVGARVLGFDAEPYTLNPKL